MPGFDFKTDSPAAAFVDGQDQFSAEGIGPAPVSEALRDIPAAFLAGLDHLTSVAAILRCETSLGFGIATAARGGIENYGRVWFLASAKTRDELLARWLRTRITSVHWLAKATKDEPEAHKVNTDLKKLLETAAAGLGIARGFQGLKYTDLATEVLNATGPRQSAAKTYSILSSVAHGDRSGINTMVNHGPSVGNGLHEASFEASNSYVAGAVSPLINVHLLCVATICELFGTEQIMEPWIRHGFQTMAALSAAYSASPE